MKKPKTIYKYEPFSVQSLKNLKAQSIFYGSPLNFNDPYDCALKASILPPTKNEIEKVRAKYLAKNNLPPHVTFHLKSSSADELLSFFVNVAKKALQDHSENFLSTRGVTCFSEINNDLLMWSRYGGNYKGFCLAFDTEHIPFNQIRKVIYTSKMPKISLTNIILEDDLTEILNLFCTKSSSWSYEKEWRGIHDEANIQFTYPAAALKGVYFGPDIDFESFEIIALILAGQNPDVELWEGKRSTEDFKVLFRKVTYMSFIEAKQKGIHTQ
ncbi:DUF2971 domain-containing protein [Cellvibrio sp.]|uniref:DUF2971 domain-containing protein n=1 Tax=Cellvibrio sp. TaxID=1965322 RepID=UPI0039647ED9